MHGPEKIYLREKNLPSRQGLQSRFLQWWIALAPLCARPPLRARPHLYLYRGVGARTEWGEWRARSGASAISTVRTWI